MNKFLILLLVFFTACRGTEPNPPKTIVGQFDLRTLNSEPLPFNAGSFTVTRGFIRFHDDSTFVDVFEVTQQGETFSDTLMGTYSQSGSNVTFYTMSVQYGGIWNEPKLDLNFPGFNMGYVRR